MDVDSPQSPLTGMKGEQDVCRLSSDKENYHRLVLKKKKKGVFNES